MVRLTLKFVAVLLTFAALSTTEGLRDDEETGNLRSRGIASRMKKMLNVASDIKPHDILDQLQDASALSDSFMYTSADLNNEPVDLDNFDENKIKIAAYEVTLRNSLDPTQCLDLFWSNTDNGSAVGVFYCHGGPNQRWFWSEDGLLRSAVDYDKCLEDGFIWDCHGGKNQKWYYTNQGKIINPESKKYLGVANGCSGITAGSKVETHNIFNSGACSRMQMWIN
eukprot:204460_1